MKKQTITGMYYGHEIEVVIEKVTPEVILDNEIPQCVKDDIFELLESDTTEAEFTEEEMSGSAWVGGQEKNVSLKGSWRVFHRQYQEQRLMLVDLEEYALSDEAALDEVRSRISAIVDVPYNVKKRKRTFYELIAMLWTINEREGFAFVCDTIAHFYDIHDLQNYFNDILQRQAEEDTELISGEEFKEKSLELDRRVKEINKSQWLQIRRKLKELE